MNAGPIIHPPLIVMNAGPIEHFERWDIHKEGTQGSIRRVTDALDAERIAVREALATARRIFRCAPLCKGRRAMDVWPRLARPPDRLGRLAERIVLTEHRYMREDLRVGLSFLVSAAALAGVENAFGKILLAIGGAICGENFMDGGRTLQNLGFGDLDRNGLQTLLRQGFPS